MKSAIDQRFSWTRDRFLAVVGVLFVLQAGLLFLFGARSVPRPPLSARSVRFRALGASVSEGQLLRRFFVGDPAVFLLPNPHGFSGRAWLAEPPPAYQPENQLEPPIWLVNDTARLGLNLLAWPSGAEPSPSDLDEPSALHQEPLPSFLTPEVIPTQSVFLLEGGLSGRLLGAGPLLRAWPSPQPLTRSAVQLAVNPAGEVLAARLEGSCGLAEADAEAVAKARALRFRPSPTEGTQWGQAVFQWQTIEPAAAGPLK